MGIDSATSYRKRIDQSVEFLSQEFGPAPELALVLGSGLGGFAQELTTLRSHSYDHIPHFPGAGIAGHQGRLSVATHAGQRLALLQGRVHYYEGWSLPEVVFAVRVLALWGVRAFAITNAAGAINARFDPGDLMLIRDHINLMGDNPLAEPVWDASAPRFPDLTAAYDAELSRLARSCALEAGIRLREGTYVAVKGPSFETPAEIRAFRRLGADAVGMSSVPEVIALNQLQRRVLGISCLTNRAAGMTPARLSHQEVLDGSARMRQPFGNLMLKIVEQYGKHFIT